MSAEYQACSGARVSRATIVLLPQPPPISASVLLLSKQLIIQASGRYQNFRKGVVLVDYTNGKIELPSQNGGSGGTPPLDPALGQEQTISVQLAPPEI